MTSTIIVTGASGFIAKHVVRELIERGHRVRGTLRSLDRASEVVEAVRPSVGEAANANLDFVAADLEREDGWAEAMTGADVLVHTASPFPLVQPANADDLMRPAVDGTKRALRAARDAGIGRVVLTSSSVAIAYAPLPPDRPYDERDWTDPNDTRWSPYIRSKAAAERAAWHFVETEAPGMDLTVINPGLVMGPPLDRHFGTSLKLIQRILASKDPAWPSIEFPAVDVRDVARAHAEAVARSHSAGKRYLLAERTLSFVDMAEAAKAAAPGRRVVTRRAPAWLIRLISRFDKSVATILEDLDRPQPSSGARAREELGIDYIDARESVAASVRYLIDNRLA